MNTNKIQYREITYLLRPYLLMLFLGTTNLLLLAQTNTRHINYTFPGTNTPVNLTVAIEDGLVILDGDIILGTETEISRNNGRAAAILGRAWHQGVIPYEIAPNHPQRNIILQAVNHVNQNTNLSLIARNPLIHSDYVRFISSDQCRSALGRGGRQDIELSNQCGFGAAVHEIGHAAGLFHEQARSDRNRYVTINWDNIQEDKEGNFQTYLARRIPGFNHGPYNYNSIMHYSGTAFGCFQCADGVKYCDPDDCPTDNCTGCTQLTTITVKTPPALQGTRTGQRAGLDQGDIDAINHLHPCRNDILHRPCGGLYYRNIHTNGKIEAARGNNCSVLIINEHPVVWEAGESITLYPGFSTLPGANLQTRIKTCENSRNRLSESDEEEEDIHSLVLESDESDKLNMIKLNIYPNPVTGNATLEYQLPIEMPVQIVIYDLNGKPVQHVLRKERSESGKHLMQIDASTLSPGIYICTIKTLDKIESVRFTVFRE